MKGLVNYSLLFLILISNLNVFGQQITNSRQSSYLTYIYKLTDTEARKVYKNNYSMTDASVLHTLVDSFPTDQQYDRILPKGHYLKTFAKENKQEFLITTIQDFDVFIFNNNTDLCIQVYDFKGNRIDEASVKVREKKLRFNQETQSYIDKKSNQKGLLQVTYNGFTCYYHLSRRYNNSFIKRGTRKLLYSVPVRYVWKPIKFVTFLPIDGVKSIVKFRSYGTIRRTGRIFVNAYEKVACLFDDYYCEDSRFEEKLTGYIVFNKPKYLPGDTVKLKAFLVTKKGKPVHKKVSLILQNGRKETEIVQLNPYRKGGYSYAFILHDSLQLKLDKHYSVHLQLNDKKRFITGSFRYEDYELSKNNLELRVDQTTHYRNKDFSLFVNGKDENELIILDARIEVVLTPSEINKYFAPKVFIPDTLFYLEKKLHPSEETEVVIPSTNFPKANIEYAATVRLLTSDNEVVTKQKQLFYKYNAEEFDINLKADSIQIDYLKNDQKESKQITVNALDNFDNESLIYQGKTPCKISLNPFFSYYKVYTDSLTKYIETADEPSLIQCFSERTKDSIYIEVKNPRKIPFHYNIYKRNVQQALGFSDSLNLQKKLNSKQNYYVSIRYLWGGKVMEENYKIPYIDKKLNIVVTQPQMVYPGQKSQIELFVTDTKGNPVEDVDITAFSLTKKFDYKAPEIPYLGKSRKEKNLINNFNFDTYSWYDQTRVRLDYDSWKTLARIDTIEYYKFIYPENGIYRFGYQAKDAITQFAPFVVSHGERVPIHVIYVDNKPVYFSWTTNRPPYSFRIDPGYHKIKLRTSLKEITIDSVYFEEGKKMILSIDQNSENNNISTKYAKSSLSETEKRVLYQYILPYKANSGEHYPYLKQGSAIQILDHTDRHWKTNFAGPVSGNITFHLIDSFSTQFYHEPFFEYEFSPRTIKLREINKVDYPENLLRFNSKHHSLTDEVITQESIEQQWKRHLDSKRKLTPRYQNPFSTSPGAGRLQYSFKEKNTSDYLLNVLVFKNNNHKFLRVYPGNNSTIHDLKEGHYKLIFFYSGDKYHIEDSLYIQANGLTHFDFVQPDSLQKDTFSIKVSKLIEETLFKPNYSSYDTDRELEQINNEHQRQFHYLGGGDVIEGYLHDDEGEPIIYGNVIIKGTTIGTTTDLDGYYSIKIPAGYNTLVFSYTGYTTQEQNIGYSSILNVKLSEGVVLEQAVVTALSIQRSEKALSFSATTVTGIRSRPANVPRIISTTAGVSISSENPLQITTKGTSTLTFDKRPLIIINGHVYMGDIAEIDPAIIEDMQALEGEEATAFYGSRASNGVVIIQTKPGTFKPLNRTINDDRFQEATHQNNSIRDNFSDYAFWQPRLTTNKEGKVSFEVEFPDDVTNWETHYLAMNNNRQSGKSQGQIKSYKPLMAQLALPRFLVEGDTTHVIGKSLNYMPDSIEIKTTFEVNGQEQSSNSTYCSNALIDTLSLVANQDSLDVKYFLETTENYMDGERRNLPVFPKGIQVSEGNFYSLTQDTSIQLQFDANLGPVKLYAKSDLLDVVRDEIGHLANYKYYCNEQIASKLKALIAEKKIAAFQSEKFKHNKSIEKLVRLLQKNQKGNGLWAWWRDSSESLWISLHVLEALAQAEQIGYKRFINKGNLTELLLTKFDRARATDDKIRILKMLTLFKADINYQYFIAEVQQSMGNSLNELLHVMELQMRCNLDFNIDTLKTFQKTTMLGNIYYSDTNKKNNILNNDVQNTLLAYKLLQSDSTVDATIFSKMRNYFLENRQNGYWQNTFESAQIIETILPDLLKSNSSLSKPTLVLKGDVNKTISEFPFELTVNPDEKIKITKSGDYPVYFTSYQSYWNNQPDKKKNDFEISTRFNNLSSNNLTGGQETKLITTVSVKKSSEYVMINIPIPGGCSYANKNNSYANEAHREYFKNETAIFCDYLPEGEHTFVIDLTPRYSGSYTINPARIELMYFPVVNANNSLKVIKIE